MRRFYTAVPAALFTVLICACDSSNSEYQTHGTALPDTKYTRKDENCVTANADGQRTAADPCSTSDHPSGDYPSGDYPSGDYASGDNPPGDYSAGVAQNTPGSEQARRRLAIEWQQIEQGNPFSTALISYEVWLNNRYVHTTEDTRYEIQVDTDINTVYCVQIRAVSGDNRSEFSDRACTPV